MQNKNKKFNRRRALICKMIRPSRNHKGYFEYRVTIGEKDGTTHTEPAYGKDMQAAIQRLLWKERTKKIESKLTAGWIFIAWLATMAWPAFLVDTEGPKFLLFSMGSVLTIVISACWWWNHVNKN